MTLTRQEVLKVVNRYIGVDGGYLGDFSYRTHADFYPEYCDLDTDPIYRLVAISDTGDGARDRPPVPV